MNAATTVADTNSETSTRGAEYSPSRRLFWTGVALALACLAAFVGQIAVVGALVTPWYLPVGGTIAALVILYALTRQRSWWQILVALPLVALAAFEWYFLLALTVLPAYTGPIAVGSAIPAFRATLADGREMTDEYFREHGPTALVFFQGRWCPFCMTQLKELEAHHDQFSSVGAEVVVVSIEDLPTAAETQRQFPHLVVVSDEQRELSSAIDLINPGRAPDGGDTDTPTMLLVDRQGKVRWFHRPTRLIARPSAADLVGELARLKP